MLSVTSIRKDRSRYRSILHPLAVLFQACKSVWAGDLSAKRRSGSFVEIGKFWQNESQFGLAPNFIYVKTPESNVFLAAYDWLGYSLNTKLQSL